MGSISKKSAVWLLVAAVAVLLVFWAMAQVKDYNDKNVRLGRQAEEAANRGEFVQAIELYKELRSRVFDRDKKFAITLSIAVAYENKGDNNLALETYRQAEKEQPKPNKGVAAGIARTSQALGDKATAIEYYKLLIKLTETEINKDPQAAGELADYKQAITELGGKQ